MAAAMQPPARGRFGACRKEMLQKLPGYDPDVAKNRAEAREIMKKLGYGPDNRLKVKVSTRDIPPYRDPAVILLDQLKEIYIDAELETVDTTQWYPKSCARTTRSALNLTGTYVDDPDALLYENYACGGVGNYNGYCNPEIDKLIDQQSMETDQDKRQQAGLGDRTSPDRRRRQAAGLFQQGRDLLAARSEEPDGDGEQHLQRLADGGYLARQIAPYSFPEKTCRSQPRNPRPPMRCRAIRRRAGP